MIIFATRSYPSARKPRTLQWYHQYAETVLSALQHPRFQRFLSWLLRHEHIPLQRIKTIQIRMFPRIKANGYHLKGAATSSGIITLYPQAISENMDKDPNQTDTFALKYVEWRARATLIHELLHYKYRHREQRVRQLTRHYTSCCMQPTTSAMQRVFSRIFRARAPSSKPVLA
jgi:hypothetical protein